MNKRTLPLLGHLAIGALYAGATFAVGAAALHATGLDVPLVHGSALCQRMHFNDEADLDTTGFCDLRPAAAHGGEG